MSGNGTIYQYQNQIILNENQNQMHKLGRLPETPHLADCATITKSEELNENIKMINNNKTPLNFTTNTPTDYKRNDYRQYYDPKEASGETFSQFSRNFLL